MQSYDSGRLEPKPGNDGIRYLFYDALETRSRHQEFRRVLVPTDFLQSQRTGSEPFPLLDGPAVVGGGFPTAVDDGLPRRRSGRACNEVGRWAAGGSTSSGVSRNGFGPIV